ncbi:hypothetical protein GGR43_004494 [Sphingobium jiangsuense]|uniref:Rhamnogalacturonase A/B/Epimerase-like pectate lyase domain-containing protein n=2 Tax=Sphingobium jiangsuense TaxID=870476 RepID=A0A7W6BVP2_9SPHN|nr:glycosyl hydrolase family 28-related protein [Sphingobium jiangsuense]MBB3928749.1 hypothetical protein [Sphingobium jiangsuense]
MAYYSAINPYPIFLDQRGGGLNGGKIFIGAPNQDPETHPIAIYWDEAGTDPVAQPANTIGGYIVRAGTPAQVYGPTEYSIRVRDRFGAQVFYEPDARGPLGDFIDKLASGEGAGMVGFSHASDYPAGTLGRKGRDYISVKDAPFNAAGDGETDDTAAFATAINFCLAAKKALYIPGGNKYRIASRITVTMPNPAVGPMATWAFSRLTIFGDGMDNTEVFCPSNGFLRVVGSSQQHSVDLTGFSVTAGTAGGNTAIEMDCGAYPFFGEWTAKSVIRLHFRGSDGINNVFFWGTAVEAIDWSNIDFSHSMFDGASTPAGTGVITRSNAGEFVCVFDFTAVHFRFLALGYRYGTGSQSANLNACFFAMNNTDVYAPADGVNHQGLSITNSDCFKFAPGDGVYIACSVPNFVFSGNRWAVHAGYRGVAMDIVNQASIIGNQFFPDTDPNTAVSAIDIDGTVSGSHCLIDDNNFASTTIGARLRSGSTNIHFGAGNVCTTGMTLVIDAGTNNRIGALVDVPIGRIGYATGAGGTITQATSKTTGVTINTPVGQIITHNAALPGGAAARFTVTNSAVRATDIITVLAQNGDYEAKAFDIADGSFRIALKNDTGGSLSDAVTLNFAIVSGANA